MILLNSISVIVKKVFISLMICIFISPFAISEDRTHAPKYDWSSSGKVDFCPTTNTFDFRNAYWMGALSTYSYWHLNYIEKVVKAGINEKVKVIFEKDANGDDIEQQEYETLGLGFATRKSQYFSSKIPRPESRIIKSLTRRFTPPLPEPACRKPEMHRCFNYQTGSFGQPPELLRECGDYNEKAYFDTQRLNNIVKLINNKNSLSNEEIDLATKDKKYIENEVQSYEEGTLNVLFRGNKKVSVRLDWNDKYITSRCDPFNQSSGKHIPDTQGSIFENEDAIFIVFRGTESGNYKDIATDLLEDSQVNLETGILKGDKPQSREQLENYGLEVKTQEGSPTNAQIGKDGNYERNAEINSNVYNPEIKVKLKRWPGAKGFVHMGFYSATNIARDWVTDSLDRIREDAIMNGDKEVSNKPIFITGHSLGGAIANLITYNLLRINNQKAKLAEKNKKEGKISKTPFIPYNVKALYTFGSPRVGDLEWAQSMQELAEKYNVGLYRIVNENDLITHVPCLKGYTHVGTLLKMEEVRTHFISNDKQLSLNINPIEKQLIDKSIIYPEYSSCADETALKNIKKLPTMLSDHFMNSYYPKLLKLRSSLNDAYLSNTESQKTDNENIVKDSSIPKTCEIQIEPANENEFLKINGTVPKIIIETRFKKE